MLIFGHKGLRTAARTAGIFSRMVIAQREKTIRLGKDNLIPCKLLIGQINMAFG
jgi:hypothetical protein